MNYFNEDIEKMSKDNTNFRKVLKTGRFAQLVVMSIPPGEDIGMETHENGDQMIRVESGNGKAIVNGEESEISDGHIIFVPAGAEHNFVNTGDVDLKVYSIYAPPEHPDGTIHATKADADNSGHSH